MTEMWNIQEPPLRMCAVEDEGFFIARDVLNHQHNEPVIMRDYATTITLTKDEKFMLYQQLQQNIEINHARNGYWFLSPMADYHLRLYLDGKLKGYKEASAIGFRLRLIAWALKGVLK